MAAGVLGLGLAAHSASASADGGSVERVRELRSSSSAFVLPALEPGTLALMGLAGVVACWPGAAGRRSRRDTPENPPEPGSVGTRDEEVLSSAA